MGGAYSGDTHILADASLGEEFEELELTQGAEAEHRVLKGRDLLDRDLATAGPVDGRADDAICTLADDIEDLVLCAHVEANLTGCGCSRRGRWGLLLGWGGGSIRHEGGERER